VPDYTIHRATEADRPGASRLMWRSFYPTGQLLDVPHFADGRHTWAMVAKADDRLVAALSVAYTLDNVIRGAHLPLAAIFGIATDPSHRRLGCVRAMFCEAFPRMHEQGLVFAALDPFSERFYGKFGFSSTEQYAQHTIKPGALRHLSMPQGVAVRELQGEGAFPRVHRLRKTMARFGSRIFVPLYPNHHGLPKHWYAIERQDEIIASVSFDMRDTDQGRKLFVRDLAYSDTEGMFGAMALIARFGESNREIDIVCDVEAPIQHLVTEREATTVTRLHGSMMTRIVDLRGYGRRIKVPQCATRSVVVALSDPYCPWNQGTWRLQPHDGRLAVESVEESTPDICLSASQLAHVTGGRTPPTLLQELGMIHCSPETADALEAIWPPQSFMSYMRF